MVMFEIQGCFPGVKSRSLQFTFLFSGLLVAIRTMECSKKFFCLELENKGKELSFLHCTHLFINGYFHAEERSQWVSSIKQQIITTIFCLPMLISKNNPNFQHKNQEFYESIKALEDNYWGGGQLASDMDFFQKAMDLVQNPYFKSIAKSICKHPFASKLSPKLN
jgi:hypothetical protein